MQWFKIVFLKSIITFLCFCEIVLDNDRFTKAFVDHLNQLSGQQSAYEEPVLARIETIAKNEYYLEIKVKATDRQNLTSAHEYLHCFGIVTDLGDTTAFRDTECVDFVEGWTDNKDLANDLNTGDGAGYTIDSGPISNEIQPSNTTQKLLQGSLVDPNTASATDLATLGIRQLNRHEPNTKHSLNKVILVERQVQVVGRIRYIITFNVDYENCTEHGTEYCIFQKTCKVTILQMPRYKLLPKRSKIRVILANNCTEDRLSDGNISNSNRVNMSGDNSIINDNLNISSMIDNLGPKTSGGNIPNREKNITVGGIKFKELPTVEMSLKYRTDKKDKNQKNFKLAKEFPRKYVTSPEFQQRLQQRKPMEVEYESINEVAIDPNYFRLAEESLAEYSTSPSGTKRYYKPIEIVKVTQVVAGTLIKIIFKASATNCEVDSRGQPTSSLCEVQYKGDLLHCLSDIDRPWGGKKNITVSCSPVKYRQRRQTPGGQIRQDPNNPRYLNLAEESLAKYVKSYGNRRHYKLSVIIKVTTQVVSGVLTRIEFTASATNCAVDSNGRPTSSICEVQGPLNYLFCESTIWEQAWLNKQDIDITCTPIAYRIKRFKRQGIAGGEVPQNPRDPRYFRLAEQSLAKYEKITGIREHYKPIIILRVTTQVVSGVLTRIEFTASATNCAVDSNGRPTSSICEVQGPLNDLTCQSRIWEQAWLNMQDIDITCTPIASTIKPLKRPGIVGGEVPQNPRDPWYFRLAEQSLAKYEKITGIRQHYKPIVILQVTTQVVAGVLTRIEFTASATNCAVDSNGRPTSSICEVQGPLNDLICQSRIREQAWLNKQDIDITCNPIASTVKPSKRQGIAGGEVTQDPRDPRYFRLAEQSLAKYEKITGIREHYKPIVILRVTTQMVSGVLTRIEFTASATNCAVDSTGRPTSSICEVQGLLNDLTCQSGIWEQAWLNKQDIDITCTPIASTIKPSKRQGIAGGEVTQDPRDPRYFRLAEQSLAKYEKITGIRQHYKPIVILRVTTQVVSGMLTRIEFTASATNCAVDSNGRPTSSICEVQGPLNDLTCQSRIWEQAWLNKQDIDITCRYSDLALEDGMTNVRLVK